VVVSIDADGRDGSTRAAGFLIQRKPERTVHA